MHQIKHFLSGFAQLCQYFDYIILQHFTMYSTKCPLPFLLYVTCYDKTCHKSLVQNILLRYRLINMSRINTKHRNFPEKYWWFFHGWNLEQIWQVINLELRISAFSTSQIWRFIFWHLRLVSLEWVTYVISIAMYRSTFCFCSTSLLDFFNLKRVFLDLWMHRFPLWDPLSLGA